MSIDKALRYYVCCIAILAFAAPFVQARQPQDDSRDDRTLEEYNELLDLIFPRDLYGTRYAFAVRITPSFDSESQLVVRVELDDSIHVELMKVVGRSAWDTLSDRRLRDTVLSFDDLAKRVKVERRPVAVSRETLSWWQESYFRAVRATMEELEHQARSYQRTGVERTWISADGVIYSIWYWQGGVDSYWRVSDGELTSRLHSPLAQWVAEVMERAEQ